MLLLEFITALELYIFDRVLYHTRKKDFRQSLALAILHCHTLDAILTTEDWISGSGIGKEFEILD